MTDFNPEDPFQKRFDATLNMWTCGLCGRPLRSDGECTTRKCASDVELKRTLAQRKDHQ